MSAQCSYNSCDSMKRRKRRCRAPEFFNTSAAFRRAEGVDSGGIVTGYAAGDVFLECEALPGSCCAMFFVPVVAGMFTVTDMFCPGQPEIAQIVVTGNQGTLEQDSGVAPTIPPNLANVTDPAWPGYASAINLEVALGAPLPVLLFLRAFV